MEDSKIIELYFSRSQDAIKETASKYEKYLLTIAMNILYSHEDSEECVNDTYLAAWESIPPKKPERLSAFLGRIVRNSALDRYAAMHTQKRSTYTQVALDELGECISDTPQDANVCEQMALRDALNSFLEKLPKRTRIIFVRRYFYLCSVSEISMSLQMSESNVKVTLLRTRQKLRTYLQEEGIFI